MSTPHEILDATCFVTLMSRDMLTGKSHLPRIVMARKLFIAVATIEGKNISVIARTLKRDRTTALYHKRWFEALDDNSRSAMMHNVERVRAELLRRQKLGCAKVS